MSKKAAGVFVVAAMALLCGFDLYLNFDGIGGNTYSEKIRGWGWSFKPLMFMIAAFVGALIGHWFLKKKVDPSLPQAHLVRRQRLWLGSALLGTIAVGMALGALLW